MVQKERKQLRHAGVHMYLGTLEYGSGAEIQFKQEINRVGWLFGSA